MRKQKLELTWIGMENCTKRVSRIEKQDLATFLRKNFFDPGLPGLGLS